MKNETTNGINSGKTDENNRENTDENNREITDENNREITGENNREITGENNREITVEISNRIANEVNSETTDESSNKVASENGNNTTNEIDNEANSNQSKMKNYIVNGIYFLFFLLCICICVYLGHNVYSETIKKANEGKKGKISLEEFEEKAKEYYYEKYGIELNIKESGYIYIEGIVETESKDMYIKTEGDAGEIDIIYREEKNEIYDNGQSDCIGKALEDEILRSIADKTLSEAENENLKIYFENAKWNVYGEGRSVKGSFYHELYHDDIGEFVRNENIVVSNADVYVICENDYGRDVVNTQKFVQEFTEEAENIFTGFGESKIVISFLSDDCYSKYLETVYRKPDIDMDECYSKYIIGKDSYSYAQNYIKVADGIYITSVEKDFVLKENDIKLTETIGGEELNELLADNYKEMKKDTEERGDENSSEDDWNGYHQVIRRTPVYRMEFSDRVKEFINQKTYKELKVCIKFVPEEAGVTGNLKEEIEEGSVDLESLNEIIGSRLNEELELGKEASDEQKKELRQECIFYYYRVSDERKSDKCQDIYSDMSDAEFALVNENDYYFGGYLIKIAG